MDTTNTTVWAVAVAAVMQAYTDIIAKAAPPGKGGANALSLYLDRATLAVLVESVDSIGSPG